MKALSKKAFDSVTEMFHGVSGIRLGEHKMALVSGRLQRLAQEAGEMDVDRYVDRLVNGSFSAQEARRVIDRLTTNETYFFREPQHFEALEKLVSGNTSREELLVWSAASSSGEEAYSIAMLLAEKAGRRPWRVIGTDLSSTMVAAAQRALYPIERARMVPPEYLRKYCRKGTGKYEGQLLISPELRERVSFGEANLMQALPEQLPAFDVIFLRNVLIYFDNDAKAQIVRGVLGKLKRDGVLYTGHAESITMLNLPVRPLGTAMHGHA
ncbi:MAG: SAM-dependent methyltransferase [Rubrivivax sp.]|nr:SAM-dependent methyltransferase [Rubrivivax sp.]